MMSARIPSSALALAALQAALAGSLAGQATVEEALGGLDAANAAAYVAPLARSLARGLALHQGGRFTVGAFTLRVGARATAVGAEEGDGWFEATKPHPLVAHPSQPPPRWDAEGGSLRTPTAVGAGAGVVLRPEPGSAWEEALMGAGLDPADLRIAFPDGLELDPAPLYLVDGDLGLGSTTSLAFRLTPTSQLVHELGDVAVLGARLSHEVGHYVLGAEPPVEVGLGVGLYRMRAGGWFETVGTTWALSASAAKGPVRMRAAGSLGSVDADVRYRAANPEAVPGLPPDGESVRLSLSSWSRRDASVGVTLLLGRLELEGDYGFGGGGSLSAAAFLRLR